MSEIQIIKFGHKLVGGSFENSPTSFGAFLRAIINPVHGYTNFVSSSISTKIYRQKSYDLVRLSFNQLYKFTMLGGFGVYSYREGCYYLEFWEYMGSDHYALTKFQYIPFEDFITFVEHRHKFDDRCVGDNIQSHFDSI